MEARIGKGEAGNRVNVVQPDAVTLLLPTTTTKFLIRIILSTPRVRSRYETHR